MNISVIFQSIAIASIMMSSVGPDTKEELNSPAQKNDIAPFLGQWSFDIETKQVGWLEVRQEDNYIDASLLWASGSVLPASYVFVNNDVLYVGRNIRKIVRTKDEKGNELSVHNIPSWLEAKRDGEYIVGHYFTPNPTGIGYSSIAFKGKKLPDVPPAPDLSKVKFGKPIKLIDDKELKGWKLIEQDKANGWTLANGVLTNDPVQKEGSPAVRYGNLRTEQEFEDFNLKFEVNIPPHSNSGVYLRGRYEIQVIDSYGRPLDSHNMGALYSRIVPAVSAEKPAGEWQNMEITLCDRHVTVILNGKTIIDNQPVYGPTGGALTSDVFAPGPIYLQGDHGKVMYRNMVIAPIIKSKTGKN